MPAKRPLEIVARSFSDLATGVDGDGRDEAACSLAAAVAAADAAAAAAALWPELEAAAPDGIPLALPIFCRVVAS